MRVHVTTPTANVFVTKTFEVELQDTDNILILKQKIEDVTGIPAQDQWLCGPWDDLMASDGPLAEFHIHDGAELCVRQYIWFSVRTLAGSDVTLLAETCDTVRQVKHWLEDKTAIPVREQRLCFEGYVLEDERTLGEYNVKEKSTVNLLRVCEEDPWPVSQAGLTAGLIPYGDVDWWEHPRQA